MDDAPSAEDSALARALLVDRFGPRCAAWLVGAPWHKDGGQQRRAKFHRRGQKDIVVPDVDRAGAPYELPMWFSLAVAFLQKRKGWGVDVIRHRGERRYRIKWMGWMRDTKRLGATARVP